MCNLNRRDISVQSQFCTVTCRFVALSEILIEGSIASLEEAGHSRKASTRYGIMLFFAGCSIVLLLDLVRPKEIFSVNIGREKLSRQMMKQDAQTRRWEAPGCCVFVWQNSDDVHCLGF